MGPCPGKGYKGAAAESLARIANVRLDTPLENTTGCPAAVSLGNPEGSAVRRLLRRFEADLLKLNA